MKSDVFIEQEVKAGSSAHYHQGVWWQSHCVGVCKPVLPFLRIVPGAARPKLSKAMVGYNHLAPIDGVSGRRAAFYVMNGPRLQAYCIDSLTDGKRRAIFKARHAGIVIARIANLEPLWEDLKELAISATTRTGYGRSEGFYRTHFTRWQSSIRNEFAKPGREWWGAFHQGKLGAYMYGYLLEETMHLTNVKVHTEFMKLHAGDLLLFSVIEYSKTLPECRQVDVGRSSPKSPSVDRWKELHGFERIEWCEHYWYSPPLRLILRLLLRLEGYVGRAEGATGFDDNGSYFARRLYRRWIEIAERIALPPQQ